MLKFKPFFVALCAFVLALSLTGCAVHPLQEDVTHIPTLQIVRQIRAEARQAIEKKVIVLLKGGSPRARALGCQLEQKPEMFATITRNNLSTDKERDFFDRYFETGVAMEFTFDVTEDDLTNTQVDFVRLLTGGTVGLGLKASADRSRQNIRKFLITDTFKSLLQDTTDRTMVAVVPPNLAYPISGTIGLGEVIDTFVDLNEGENLTAAMKAPVFGDQLTFLTIVSGSANPSVVLTPIGHAFRLSDASLTAQATRTDRHLLNIALSRPPPKSAADSPRTVATAFGLQPLRTVFAKRSGASAAVDRAVEAITQQRIDTFYDRFGQIAR